MTTQTTARPRSEVDRQRRQLGWVLLAAAVAVIVVVAIVLADGDDGGDALTPEPDLELSLGAGDAMASCLALDAEIMADMSVAFAGTAIAVDDRLITLEVDRWYRGGDAEVVALTAETFEATLIGGFPFEVGEQYLITAENGFVNLCGYSGPASPELQAVFDQAFAA